SRHHLFSSIDGMLVNGPSLTSIGTAVGLAFSCQIFKMYFPGGTLFRTNFPSLPVLAKYGVSVTTTYADISACTLHSIVHTPGLSKRWNFVVFCGYVPRLKRGGPGEKTLCRISSLLGKATVEPSRTARTCGTNVRLT